MRRERTLQVQRCLVIYSPNIKIFEICWILIEHFLSTVQDNELDGSELDSSNDEEWESDSSRYV